MTRTATGLMKMMGFKMPESKEALFNCPVHGEVKYTTYQQADGEWKEVYCPHCRKEELEHQNLLTSIQQEAKERAVELSRALRTEKPQDFEGATFDNYVPEDSREAKNLKVCRAFADRFTIRELERERAHNAQEKDWRSINSVGLLLEGHYGTGKTHLCYSILKSLEAQGIPGFYTTIPDLFDRLSDRDNRVEISSVMAKLTMVSCLVLDELGVQSGNEYERKRLYQIIDGRIKNGRPTILVTNLERAELDILLTQRVTDRIKQATYQLEFTGRSRRKKITEDQLKEVF